MDLVCTLLIGRLDWNLSSLISFQDDKLRGLSDRMTSIYIELNDDINQRALASTVTRQESVVVQSALFEDSERTRNSERLCPSL